MKEEIKKGEIINYSAQDFEKLTKAEKDILKANLEKNNDTLDNFEARLKELYPKEVTLPKANWRKR